MLKGVAFDLDGTLLDTMPIWDAAIGETFALGGLPYSTDVFRAIMNTTITEVVRVAKEELHLAASVDELLEPLTPTFLRMARVTEIRKKEGADVLLNALTTAEIPFTLATSSPRDVLELLLASVGWQNRFPLIVCGDNIENDKPAPDIFTAAALKLQCTAGNCIAFEDAPKGVASAKAAGMIVVALDDPRFGFNLTHADHLVASYNHLTVNDLKHFLS